MSYRRGGRGRSILGHRIAVAGAVAGEGALDVAGRGRSCFGRGSGSR